ncbi:MAG: tetratricopeptide repeat protein [Cyclobacteriaceae bacterium]|nr:tetratricopeptide repeat protein [Cyclobacteriaceae bacterium]
MRIILTIVFGCCLLSASAQVGQIDSLRLLINREKDPKHKVELLNSLSAALFAANVEKANETTLQALELARQLGDVKGEGWATEYRGVYFMLSGNLDQATAFFESAFAIGKKIKDGNLQSHSLTYRGNVMRDKGSFGEAYSYYQQARAMDKVMNAESYYTSVICMNLSRLFLVTHRVDSALRLAQQAFAIRERLTNPVFLADAYMLLGNCYRSLDSSNVAEQYYQKGFDAAPTDPIIQADYLQYSGELFLRKGNFKQALENWISALEYHRKYQSKYALAELLFRIGNVCQEQGYFELASEYLNNGLNIAEKSGYKFLTGLFYHQIAWVYYRLHDFESAYTNCRRAEQILKQCKADLEVAACWDVLGLIERNRKNYDSSLFYHQKSLEMRLRLKNNIEISAGYFNLGEFYLQTGKLKAALPYYFKSLSIDQQISDNYGISLNYNRIGRLYTEFGKYDSAQFYLVRSMSLAVPSSSNEIFRDNYFDLANFFEKTGETAEAIRYYKRYNNLADSIFSKQTAETLSAYRTLYDIKQNEQQIELLNKDNQLARAQVQRQRFILFSVLSGSSVLLLVAGFYFRFSRKLKKLNFDLAEKHEEIQAQAEELTEANEALSKLNRDIAEQKEEIQAQAEELTESNQNLEERIEARTSELKQAFKELDTFFYRSSHDFRRPLTTFMGLAEVARVLVKDKTALELFEKVNENALNLDKMLRKLQSISDVGSQELIYKEVFLKEIMEIELDSLKPELDKKKIKTTLSVKLEQPFYSYAALIKIIIQNLLENSIAFSTPTSPLIQLTAVEKDQEIVIEVHDNGLGIEPEYIERVFEMYFRANEHSKGNGLGLYIVKKTVQKINGRVELESTAGKGTTVRVFLPHRLE